MKPTHPSDPSLNPQPTPQRDSKGRFLKGNPGGPGNPFARQVAKLRSALVNCVTEADMVRIAEDLLVKTRMGDLDAIKLFFQYVLGKPADTVNPDTLDIEEWQQTIQPLPEMLLSLPDTINTAPAHVVNGVVRFLQPVMVDRLAQTFAEPSEQSAATANPKQKSEREANPADRPAVERPSPSANGGNGPKKKVGGPSANDGNGHTKLMPPWLAEIAAKMPPFPAPSRNGHGKGRKKR